MIPKILHHIWLGKAPIPPEYLQWKDNWRQLHPEWAYILWSDNDVTHLDQLLKRCKSLSSRSNVVRLWVIKEFGGVYADMDFNWNKNINSFLTNNAFAAREDDYYFCNAFFGAIPNHEWIINQFEALDSVVDNPPPWGPTLMTNLSQGQNDLCILPTEFVYPYYYTEKYQEAHRFKNAYLVHHWNKTWYDEDVESDKFKEERNLFTRIRDFLVKVS